MKFPGKTKNILCQPGGTAKSRSTFSCGLGSLLPAMSLFLLSGLICVVHFQLIRPGTADGFSSGVRPDAPPVLELRVDAWNRARAFCNGIKAVVSIGGGFEFYEKSLVGSRKRIFSGPWNGNLKENSIGAYTLTGNDPASGASYSIVFKQADTRTIEISMNYRAPSSATNLDFGILKLSGDLFKGASIDASPAAIDDVGTIPGQPLPVARRILLVRKNRVLIKSALCDLEIKDLMESNTILAADFRNIPWDNYKSIHFGAGKDNLSPGKNYSFRYSIRCLPPTRSIALQKAKVSGSPVEETNAWSFYLLPPKKESKERGHYQLRRQDSIYGMPSGMAETILDRGLEKLTSMRLPIKTLEQGRGGRGIFIERILHGAASGLPPEGFEIITSQEKVHIRGVSERACLYGVYAVMGRLRHEANNWEMESGTIQDWPDLPVRGVCIEMLKPAIRDVDLMKRYLDAFSMARSNIVIFLHTPQQIRAWKRNENDGGWTKEQITEIARYARSLQMDVWGGMGTHFKPADFRELEIRPGANIYNPSNERSYEYLFSLYGQILQAYSPTTLLISHDEIQGLSKYAAESGKSPGDILATDVGRIRDWLARRNLKTAIWGDMLMDHQKWEAEVGSANSRNPAFNSGATHEALQKIPTDVLILDWHYDEKKDYGSIEYFRRNGFSVIGSPWHDPKAARSFAQSVKRYGGQGILTTDWGFFSTLSPAATTLYGPICAWTAKCVIDDKNMDVDALAETMREGIYHAGHPGQIEISLAEFANNSLGASTQDNRKGLFGIGPVLDLSAFLPGRQVLGKVSFDVASDEGGRKNNCVLVTSFKEGSSSLPSETVVFKKIMGANAIAFLHTGFVEEPQFRPRKIGKYVVEFANGITETIDLIENWNITDIRSSEGLRHNDWTFFRSPDVLIGAKTGWRGSSASGMPLNVQVFIWKNPNPEQKIRSIRLSAAMPPMKSKIALLGLTFLQ